MRRRSYRVFVLSAVCILLSCSTPERLLVGKWEREGKAMEFMAGGKYSYAAQGVQILNRYEVKGDDLHLTVPKEIFGEGRMGKEPEVIYKLSVNKDDLSLDGDEYTSAMFRGKWKRVQ